MDESIVNNVKNLIKTALKGRRQREQLLEQLGNGDPEFREVDRDRIAELFERGYVLESQDSTGTYVIAVIIRGVAYVNCGKAALE